MFLGEGNSARHFIALWQHCLFDCTLNYTSASARLHGLLDTAHVMPECGKERETMKKKSERFEVGRRQHEADISGYTTCHLRVCACTCIISPRFHTGNRSAMNGPKCVCVCVCTIVTPIKL
jgi:hypothetical protein